MMAKQMAAQIKMMFEEFHERLERLNCERLREKDFRLPKAEIILLGQISLLVNEKISAVLSLVETGDVDALLKMDTVVKKEFETVLKKYNFFYDEDSELIWIPPGTKFEEVATYTTAIIKIIDPESALVSKAVKAPVKNKQLIREALASGMFSNLTRRIEENGGKLEDFL